MITREDIIRSRASFEPSAPCWLSLYEVSRCFGGPEEGGWWYTVWRWIGGIRCVSQAEAESFVIEAQREADELNEATKGARAAAYAVLGDEPTSTYPEGYIPTGWTEGGEVQIIIEQQQGQHDTTAQGRPHYE